MNWKTWAPLAVAIVLGLVAAMTARNLVTRRPVVAAAGAGAQVVVVKQPVLPGQQIKADDVVLAGLAWKEAPEGTFRNVADVVGRVATVPMVKGQPVLESVLASSGAGGGLQALVPEGMRAISIEVNEFSSVAGLVAPGCSVDVVATIEDEKTKQRMARTIVQDVKVMAVGQRVSAGKEAKDQKDPSAVAAVNDPTFKSVTLLTTPAEAEALELASMIGRPRLVLRGYGDKAAARSGGVTVAQLYGDGEESSAAILAPGDPTLAVRTVMDTRVTPATQPAFDQHVVKVIKGGVESTVTFNVERRTAVTPAQVPPGEVLTDGDTGFAIPR
jgi:pilus assembly protein CpaB